MVLGALTRTTSPVVAGLRRLLPVDDAALANAWTAVVDAARGRHERELLAPGGRPEGRGQWLDEVAEDECWALLASDSLGRLAFTVNAGAPLVVPVNYCVHERSVVIRSGRGPKLAAAARNDAVAFEADAIDRERHTGWSVVVTGRARVVRSAAERARLALVEPQPWAAGPRDDLIVVTATHISGRRMVAPAPAPEPAS